MSIQRYVLRAEYSRVGTGREDNLLLKKRFKLADDALPRHVPVNSSLQFVSGKKASKASLPRSIKAFKTFVEFFLYVLT